MVVCETCGNEIEDIVWLAQIEDTDLVSEFCSTECRFEYIRYLAENWELSSQKLTT